MGIWGYGDMGIWEFTPTNTLMRCAAITFFKQLIAVPKGRNAHAHFYIMDIFYSQYTTLYWSISAASQSPPARACERSWQVGGDLKI
jgi:hypothetical protein